MLIKRGDMVEVVAGDDRSRKNRRTVARVLRVISDEDKIVVEGVNKVYKHVRHHRRTRVAADSRKRCRSMCRTFCSSILTSDVVFGWV